MLRVALAILAMFFVAACNTNFANNSSSSSSNTSSSSLNVDPTDVNDLFTIISRRSILPASGLPAAGTSTYRGYISIPTLRSSTTAIGQMDATVNFGSRRFTMSTGRWIVGSGSTTRNTTGSLSGSGNVVVGSTAGVQGTLGGSVDGTRVSVNIFGNFTGTSFGPTGLAGGADSGSSHSIRYGLD